MRLINTSTLELHEFYDDAIPHYAILSHRWEKEEVTFQDFQSGKGPSMAGWAKIAGCCAQARRDTWEYAWVDSCCIDKTSSAELSEAINSMFRWYKRAEICYVHLSDVKMARNNEASFLSQLEGSKWFTRGWTLQELLAPELIDFFDKDWEHLGTKYKLSQTIATITGIDPDDLLLFDPERTTIAQKMSWASRRQTTRIEDQAYCLMGIFETFMPTLYGEGKHAFRRLQLELIKQIDDDSIFAWGTAGICSAGSLLADSPEMFRDCGTIVRRPTSERAQSSFSMTNKGLMLEAPLVVRELPPDVDRPRYMLLGCKYVCPKTRTISRVLVPLNRTVRLERGTEDNYYRSHQPVVLKSEVTKSSTERVIIYSKLCSYEEIRERPRMVNYTILISAAQSIKKGFQTLSFVRGLKRELLWVQESPGTWTTRTKSTAYTGAEFKDADGTTFTVILDQRTSVPRLSYIPSHDMKSIARLIESVSDVFPLKGPYIMGEGSMQLPGGRQIHMVSKRAMFKGEYTWMVKIDLTRHTSDPLPNIQNPNREGPSR